ncbi:hypothetical protein O6H91_03G073200 [Diphasiastrum complanatum]|nr:hypothetical protein O6H91_03G073200 [Diphasiastrum complanatum]
MENLATDIELGAQNRWKDQRAELSAEVSTEDLCSSLGRNVSDKAIRLPILPGSLDSVNDSNPSHFRKALPPFHHEKKSYTSWQTIWLAYQTLGVVYGDIATSPLYLFSSITLKEPNENDYLGILSLVFWSITLITLIKFVFVVLYADDHGEGGNLALYSLICQHGKFTPNPADGCSRPNSELRLTFIDKLGQNTIRSKIINFLETSVASKNFLVVIAAFGISLLLGDGVLTPAISVISAIDGIRTGTPSASLSKSVVILVSAGILVALFALQRFGTRHVSFLFSPIMVAWLITTPLIGLYNIATNYPGVLKALSPHYIWIYFNKNGRHGWISLGGTILAVTGTEAMFADLGHFSRASIQLAFALIVYPSSILTYAGQAAYLIKHPQDQPTAFYKFIPHAVYWPMFAISTLAAIVASQALITASYSLVRQAMELNYFPRVKFIHTAADQEGQIYSPEVNYSLMAACLIVVFGFGGGSQIANAYGVALIWVMIITTVLVTLVMIVVWRTSLFLAFSFFGCFMLIEGVYLSAIMVKFKEGGWLPFAISVFLGFIMLTWHYGKQKSLEYEMKNQVSHDKLELAISLSGPQRAPGLCFFFTDFRNGISVPPILCHYIQTVRSVHQIVVLMTIRHSPQQTVPVDERFMIGSLGYKGFYFCTAQFGYTDKIDLRDDFVSEVFSHLKAYIGSSECTFMDNKLLTPTESEADQVAEVLSGNPMMNPSFSRTSSINAEDPLFLEMGSQSTGPTYILGKVTLKPSKRIRWVARFILGSVYTFLEKNCRSITSPWDIPTSKFVEVGMFYEI